MATPAVKKRSLEQRLTGKVGPLPVWAWAALILGTVLLYLKLHPAAATPADPASSTGDLTPVSADGSNPVGSSGGGSSASNVNDALLSQLSGFQTSIDTLTAAVQAQEAGGWLLPTDGSGIDASQNDGGVNQPTGPGSSAVAATKPAPKKAAAKPAAKPAPAPKPKPKPKKPQSGYAQGSKANLH